MMGNYHHVVHVCDIDSSVHCHSPARKGSPWHLRALESALLPIPVLSSSYWSFFLGSAGLFILEYANLILISCRGSLSSAYTALYHCHYLPSLSWQWIDTHKPSCFTALYLSCLWSALRGKASLPSERLTELLMLYLWILNEEFSIDCLQEIVETCCQTQRRKNS